MLKKRILIALLVVMALSLTACATDKGNENPDTGTPPNEDLTKEDEIQDNIVEDEILDEDNTDVDLPGKDVTTVAYEDIKLTAMEAFDKYMEKHPNTKVKKLKLDRESDSYVYEVEGYDKEKEYEIKIHPVNGDILKEDTDNDKDNSGEITKANVEKVKALVDKAIKEAGKDARLEEWALKIKDGKAMLEVEVEREGFDDVEYTYNVETGELVEKDD